MKIKIWLLMMAIVLLFPDHALAQEELVLETVQVEIWPEYDRSAVLVINHLTLPSETTLPVELILRIPAQADVNAVAVANRDGYLVNADYDQQAEGNWTRITIHASSLVIRVEYYFPFERREDARFINYTWPGDYTVNVFSIVLQQPLDSEILSTEPEVTLLGAGEDGLTYYDLSVGSMESGESFQFSVEYRKTTDRLSVSAMEVQPVSPFDGTSAVPKPFDQYLPWILGGLGLVLLALGVFGVISYRRPGHASSGKETRTRHRSEERTGNGNFCHQCGKRAQPGDQFCRTCGVRLRHPG